MLSAPEIIAGLLHHSPLAWAALHEQYFPRIVSHISRQFPALAYADEVRDIASMALLVAAQQIATGVPVQAEFLRGYVIRIAERKALKLVTERRRYLLASELKSAAPGTDEDTGLVKRDTANFERPDPHPDQEECLWKEWQAERFQTAFRLLLPRDRELLERFYYAGEAQATLMEAFALSEHQFAIHKSRAIVRLMAHYYGLDSTYNPVTRQMYTGREILETVGVC